ncbi:uncharacterized protein DS421_15g504340 [Arachis hypogaea]|nr:uncharacterized protein DS421_15g504340 [Arachis hypogaea]
MLSIIGMLWIYKEFKGNHISLFIGPLLNGVQVTAQNPEKGGTFVTNRERVCHIKVIVYS